VSLLDLIGNTPLVRLQRIVPPGPVEVWAKLEGHNPGGSVKDRAAYGMIRGALDRGTIAPGDRLLEATSGNTGIALAMIARLAGLHMTLVMPEGSTRERVLAMRAYGADVILTPRDGGIEGSRAYADELLAGGGYVMLNQFANADNVAMHERTTGPEIWRDTEGRVTHFVSAMGTTGTIMGCSRALKARNEAVQIVGTQPAPGASIPGIRRWSGEFVPAIFEPARVDRVVDVGEEAARTMTRRLAREEGILAGMSSGGALTAALQVAEELDEGVIVFIACDRGDRYLSTDLFGGA
jgi:S-sulfo-L-cysteine synthase (O-acetyl-L-serine-dependent)